MTWSAWLCVNRIASTRRISYASACARKSVDVSTSTFCTARAIGEARSVAISMRIDGRVRRSRGSVDRQTAQSHPIIGTPCDVPVPSSVILRLNDASAAVLRLDEAHPELVEHFLEDLPFFGGQVAARFFLEKRKDGNHFCGTVEIRLRHCARRRIDEVAEVNRRSGRQ